LIESSAKVLPTIAHPQQSEVSVKTNTCLFPDPPHYSEKSAQAAARMILEAIAYLHSKGICHRDLKPENLILESQDDDQVCAVPGSLF
jgi:serine/threonine protein kinase